MSVRSNGSYIGPRPTGPSSTVASGIWDLRTAERQKRAAAWPVVLATDPNFSDVALLLHMDGNDGSTTFTDSSSYGRTVTALGNAQIDTAESKYGGASALFDGTGDYLTVPDSSDFNLGAGDWTKEVWVRPASFSSTGEVLSHRDTGTSSGPLWYIRVNTDGTVRYVFANFGPTVITDITTTETLSLNTWHHIAVVRASGAVTIYVDGVSSGSGTDSSTSYGDCPADFVVGANGDAATASYFNGHIDEVRWTIGTARYTANFTPPTAAFPNS